METFTLPIAVIRPKFWRNRLRRFDRFYVLHQGKKHFFHVPRAGYRHGQQLAFEWDNYEQRLTLAR